MKPTNLRDESGVALIVAISLTLILSAMTLAITTLSITEKGIYFNQQTSTQALYNADASIEVAKEQMASFGMISLNERLINSSLFFFNSLTMYALIKFTWS